MKMDNVSGDRMWITSGDPPSDFEETIAGHLGTLGSGAALFHVKIFSCRPKQLATTDELVLNLSGKVEAVQDRLIWFCRVEEKINVKIPIVSIMYSDTHAGNIKITSSEFEFSDQTLVIVASRFDDHEAGHKSLKGVFDSIGYLSLIFGRNINRVPIISSYFDLGKSKFVNGTVEFANEAEVESQIFGIKSFYQKDAFFGDNDRTHTALWFAGKAFCGTDDGTRIIFYYTALEMMSSKNMHNYFSKLYKGKKGAEQAKDVVKTFTDLRHELVHDGKIGEFPSDLERYIQLLLLDAIVADQNDAFPNSSLLAAIDAR